LVATAGYRLVGEGLDKLCVIHLWGRWRLVVAFPEADVAVVVDDRQARHPDSSRRPCHLCPPLRSRDAICPIRRLNHGRAPESVPHRSQPVSAPIVQESPGLQVPGSTRRRRRQLARRGSFEMSSSTRTPVSSARPSARPRCSEQTVSRSARAADSKGHWRRTISAPVLRERTSGSNPCLAMAVAMSVTALLGGRPPPASHRCG